LARLGVRGTFSQPGPSHPAASGRLTRTLGLAGTAMSCASRISACRRGLNSHEKTMPIKGAIVCGLAAANRQEVRASARQTQDQAPLRLIAAIVCETACVVQSVCWAAATGAAVHRDSVAQRLEPQRAKFCLRREAVRQSVNNHQDPARAIGRARPNTSLNHRTRYGGLSWPGLGYAVHFPSPGQAIPPHRAG